MSRFRGTISIADSIEIEVEAEDEIDATEKMLDEAKKRYSENGIINPEFDLEVIEEILE